MPERALNDSQLLVLSIFCYRLDCVDGVTVGTPLGEAAARMEDALVERQVLRGDGPTDSVSQLMDYREWFSVLGNIKTSPELAELSVAAIDIDAYGGKKLLLADAQGNAYAVFGGTGRGEWEDNFIAAYERESAQQLSALAWILGACPPGRYAHVTACGHSKGGNKAFYLAVRAADVVDRAVGFDTQGFSRAFVRAYGDAILANTQKITAYALDNDYVNGLLNNIALESRRIYLDGSHVANPVACHSPFSLFVPYRGTAGTILELGGQVPQGPLGKAFREFSAYVQNNASAEEYRTICRCMSAALENILVPNVSDEERAARAKRIGDGEGFGVLVRYIARFFADTAQEVGPRDVLALLIPGGKQGDTVLDDLAIGALKAASGVLKWMTRK